MTRRPTMLALLMATALLGGCAGSQSGAAYKRELRGLDPTHSYSVTDLDSGKPRKYSGRELLERGLPIVIAEPPGAAVVTYVRTE